MKAGQIVMISEIILLQPRYRSISARQRIFVRWLNKNFALMVAVSLATLLLKFGAEALAEYILHR